MKLPISVSINIRLQPQFNFITTAEGGLKKSIDPYKNALGFPTSGTWNGIDKRCLLDPSDNLNLIHYRQEFLYLIAKPDRSIKSVGF